MKKTQIAMTLLLLIAGPVAVSAAAQSTALPQTTLSEKDAADQDTLAADEGTCALQAGIMLPARATCPECI